MRGDAVLACCAAAFGLALLFFSDDAPDAFTQLHTHPGDRWVGCSLLLDDGGDLQCVEEAVLGYGAAPPLNTFQRLAWTFDSVVVGRFEACETTLLALRTERGELGGRAVAYVAVRA